MAPRVPRAGPARTRELCRPGVPSAVARPRRCDSRLRTTLVHSGVRCRHGDGRQAGPTEREPSRAHGAAGPHLGARTADEREPSPRRPDRVRPGGQGEGEARLPQSARAAADLRRSGYAGTADGRARAVDVRGVMPGLEGTVVSETFRPLPEAGRRSGSDRSPPSASSWLMAVGRLPAGRSPTGRAGGPRGARPSPPRRSRGGARRAASGRSKAGSRTRAAGSATPRRLAS